jgi:hypothetical protein
MRLDRFMFAVCLPYRLCYTGSSWKRDKLMPQAVETAAPTAPRTAAELRAWAVRVRTMAEITQDREVSPKLLIFAAELDERALAAEAASDQSS